MHDTVSRLTNYCGDALIIGCGAACSVAGMGIRAKCAESVNDKCDRQNCSHEHSRAPAYVQDIRMCLLNRNGKK